MLSKIIKQANIDHFSKWFERAEKIVIVSHISPDGDAVGSSLGLWHFLTSQDKTANVIVPNAFPDFLKWMPGSKDILLYDTRTSCCMTSTRTLPTGSSPRRMSSVAWTSTTSTASTRWAMPCWLLLPARFSLTIT